MTPQEMEMLASRIVQMQQSQKKKNETFKNFFVTGTGINQAITALGSATPSVTIGSEPLEVKQIVGLLVPTIPGDLIRASLQISQSRNSENWFLNPVDFTLITGNGTLPFVLPITRYLEPNETITFTLKEYGNKAGFFEVELVCGKILGRKA